MGTDRSNTVQPKEKNRRNNKPMMEKRRRERINKSLNELKEIVLKAQNKDASKYTKLEKADILEMTVKHLQKMDEGCKISHNIKNTECEKYRQGFEKCLVEAENYIKNCDNLYHQPRSKQIISHLKTLCSKIPPDELCKHTSANQSNKVKATVDTSVFRSAIMTLRHPGEEQRIPTAVILPHHQNEQRVPTVEIPSRFHGEHIPPTAVVAPQPEKKHHIPSPTLPNNAYIKQGSIEFSISDNRVGVENYPPSPPESLRYSSSPDSLRGSPRSSMDYNPNINSPAFEKQIPPTPFMECSNYSIKLEIEPENKPLNLTLPSNSPRQENLLTIYHPVNKSSAALQSSSSSSSVNVKKEPSYYSNPNHIYQTFQQRNLYENYVMSNALEPTKGGGPSRASHSCNRTAPYPKKEAVKRYQNENSPLGDAEGEGGQSNHQNAQPNLQHEDLTQSHWRPW